MLIFSYFVFKKKKKMYEDIIKYNKININIYLGPFTFTVNYL